MRAKLFIEPFHKAQAAMEYLMTYGWSVLVIAIIIGTLVYMGFFNFSTNVPFECLGTPMFLCSSPSLSSSGALSVKFDYVLTGQANPITIVGLACNYTAPYTSNSYETTQISVYQNQPMNLTFQCPVINKAQMGTAIPVHLWVYYSTPSENGLVNEYATGIVKVDYFSLLWNVTEWTPSSNTVQLQDYNTIVSHPDNPSGVTILETANWPSLIAGGWEGWSYSTNWHDNDVYYGIETIPFPITPLSQDNAPCNTPYDSHGLTATAYATMSGNYVFNIDSDDGTEIFYKPFGSGTWNSVFVGQAWKGQAPTQYTSSVFFPPGKYELAVDYIDTCDPAGLSVVLISPPPTPA